MKKEMVVHGGRLPNSNSAKHCNRDIDHVSGQWWDKVPDLEVAAWDAAPNVALPAAILGAKHTVSLLCIIYYRL